MGGLFQNGINRKYFCGFGCGCEALTIGAATDAASATAATTIIVTVIVTAVATAAAAAAAVIIIIITAPDVNQHISFVSIHSKTGSG